MSWHCLRHGYGIVPLRAATSTYCHNAKLAVSTSDSLQNYEAFPPNLAQPFFSPLHAQLHTDVLVGFAQGVGSPFCQECLFCIQSTLGRYSSKEKNDLHE